MVAEIQAYIDACRVKTPKKNSVLERIFSNTEAPALFRKVFFGRTNRCALSDNFRLDHQRESYVNSDGKIMKSLALIPNSESITDGMGIYMT
jgi:hypothetical protein